MQNPEERQKRLKRLAEIGDLPIELDFLRELGFEFGLDWDGQLVIEQPKSVNAEELISLLLVFEKGIRTRLKCEGAKAQRILVGGPLNGKPYNDCYQEPNHPMCFHAGYKQWHVYNIKSFADPRAWYVGTATSKPKAQSLVR